MRRWVICAAVTLAFGPSAFAADLDGTPYLMPGAQTVGPATFTRWSGFYFGGQVGYSDVNADFSNSTQAPLAFVLRNSTLENTSHPSQLQALGIADHTGPGYGGFIGYNTQWQDVIVGLEGTFTHTSFSLNAPTTPITRSAISDGAGNSYTITVAGTGSVSDLNYGELRVRAGWVQGNFLPYGFAGLAVGVANVNVTPTIGGSCDTGSTPSCSPFSFIATSGRDSDLLYGFSVGGGLDVALTSNIFLRGEYEYIHFAQTFNIPIAISSARAGVGLKF